MFGFGHKATREKSQQEMHFKMMDLQYEAQNKLEEAAISCQTCRDIGVLAVVYVTIGKPDEPYIEYNRCECGADVSEKVAVFIRNQV